MNDSEISATFAENLGTVPGVVGVNFHMGSLASQDRRVVEIILRELQKHKLLFVDSKVVSSPLAFQVAKGLGLPYLGRDVFLDNLDDVEYIKGQLRELLELALKQGQAVGIGHIYHESTRTAIKEMLPAFAAKGVTFVPVTELFAPQGELVANLGSGNFVR